MCILCLELAETLGHVPASAAHRSNQAPWHATEPAAHAAGPAALELADSPGMLLRLLRLLLETLV